MGRPRGSWPEPLPPGSLSEDRPLWDAVHALVDCCGARITPRHVADGMRGADPATAATAAAQSALS